ncbi:WecB/TagA/CpsF family glycosyltransferase [Pseudoalteromonas sp. CR1]|uniref:WecB/TagA/CpsF family glycosyltransferase n=1 Tax=Pseudoalteromonas sp. CR1 TaxID=2861964 RepID=UPI001C5D70D7|nr:WecB/TagA/CpsF family glycosyltransferase [Pseudoalteromonas sp. CR1]MBW4966822.1 WecB/TagA/CpsF family glycosyltransferase [Pseudoalteromonas sp. CR1]
MNIRIAKHFTYADALDKRLFSFINLASIEELFKSGQDSPLIYFCDGILMSKILSVFTKEKIERVSFDFSSIANEVFTFCELNKKKVYFVGAKNSELVNFISKIKLRYPNLKIVGYYNGYFEESNICHLKNDIISQETDYLIVGLGAGKQEKFILEFKDEMYPLLAFSCGGFIRQESNSSKTYYPKLIDKFNLRAFYRMYKEPHTIKRYIISYPTNLLRLIYLIKTKKIKFEVV